MNPVEELKLVLELELELDGERLHVAQVEPLRRDLLVPLPRHLLGGHGEIAPRLAPDARAMLGDDLTIARQELVRRLRCFAWLHRRETMRRESVSADVHELQRQLHHVVVVPQLQVTQLRRKRLDLVELR